MKTQSSEIKVNSLRSMEQKIKGRRPKGKETRKAVTFRLQPAIIDRIRTISADTGCSMADLIEDMVMECYP